MFNTYPVNKHLETYEIQTPTFWNDIYDNKTPAWGVEPASVLDTFIKFLTPGSKILDIGCGEGRNSFRLASLGFEVTGIDISESAINKAKSKGMDCKFICYDALNFTAFEGFDAIIDFGLFHFVPYELRSTYAGNIFNNLKTNGIYCNQSGRLTDIPLGNNDYIPPQLVKKELEESFSNLEILYLEEDVLPPLNQFREYPCWNMVARKK